MPPALVWVRKCVRAMHINAELILGGERLAIYIFVPYSTVVPMRFFADELLSTYLYTFSRNKFMLIN